MRQLIFALILAAALGTAPPDAKAADWTNGTFSCDLTVVETSPWYIPFLWGGWQKIHAKFYQNGKPDSSFYYKCLLTNGLSGFSCLIQDNTNLTFPGWNYSYYHDPNLSPGISKSQACGAIFDKAFSKK